MRLEEIIEQQIRVERTARFAGLNLPDEFVAPNYGGRSIVNISSSIVRILGGSLPTPPLDSEIIDGLAANVHRIVLVIVDALGYRRLLDALDSNPQNGFHALLHAGARLVPLTSTFPSTTTAALTALWSGYTPAAHGMVGYQLFLREYGARSDMISFNPVATRELGKEQLVHAGLEPDKFLAVPSLPQTLEPLGIPVYHFIEQPFVKSVLSRVQVRGMRETFGFVTSSDLWVTLRAQIEKHRAERALFVAYWSAIDNIEHTYGPSSDTVLAEINNLAYSFEREFLSRLSPAGRAGTLFLLTADHGQIDSPAPRAVYVHDHPALRDHLVMDFTGEPRAAYFYCRNGELDAAREYIASRLGDKFFVVDSQRAWQAGLFGTTNSAPEVKHRIGDLIALPRADYYFWDRTDEPRMLGRHGGLAEQEMLVPFIAARLDDD
jgi:predicted AlkP superfamily pyrophosphatase or phosphodiesterase